MESRIKTDRLVLRFVTRADSPVMHACVRDPKIYTMVAQIPPKQYKTATIKWIVSHDVGRETDTNHVYAIDFQGQFTGVVGLSRKSTDQPFNLGYWASPAVWGHGYVTEVCRGLLSCLVKTKGPQRVVSGYFADNPASRKVLQKIGFVQTGENQMACAGRNADVRHILVEMNAVL